MLSSLKWVSVPFRAAPRLRVTCPAAQTVKFKVADGSMRSREVRGHKTGREAGGREWGGFHSERTEERGQERRGVGKGKVEGKGGSGGCELSASSESEMERKRLGGKEVRRGGGGAGIPTR